MGTSGPPVVVVPGAFETADTFAALGPVLAASHRVFAIDLTGTGYSEIVVDAGSRAVTAHEVAVASEHDLLHALPRLSAALVHADLAPELGTEDPHTVLASHRQA